LKIPLEEMLLEEIPLEEIPLEEIPLEEMLLEEIPLEEIPLEEIPLEEIPLEEIPLEEIPLEEMLLEEILEESQFNRLYFKEIQYNFDAQCYEIYRNIQHRNNYKKKIINLLAKINENTINDKSWNNIFYKFDEIINALNETDMYYIQFYNLLLKSHFLDKDNLTNIEYSKLNARISTNKTIEIINKFDNFVNQFDTDDIKKNIFDTINTLLKYNKELIIHISYYIINSPYWDNHVLWNKYNKNTFMSLKI
jgi:hypothetical protein